MPSWLAVVNWHLQMPKPKPKKAGLESCLVECQDYSRQCQQQPSECRSILMAHNIDITALEEVRFPDGGSSKEHCAGDTILWFGKSSTNRSLCVKFHHIQAGNITHRPLWPHHIHAPTIEKQSASHALQCICPNFIGKSCSQMVVKLLDLLVCCWAHDKLPQDLSDAINIILYNIDIEKSDCYNCRGITLLSNSGKVVARVVKIWMTLG